MKDDLGLAVARSVDCATSLSSPFFTFFPFFLFLLFFFCNYNVFPYSTLFFFQLDFWSCVNTTLNGKRGSQVCIKYCGKISNYLNSYRAQKERRLDGSRMLSSCSKSNVSHDLRSVWFHKRSERILSTERRTRVFLLSGKARGGRTMLQ